jgi:hypothetical protein
MLPLSGVNVVRDIGIHYTELASGQFITDG